MNKTLELLKLFEKFGVKPGKIIGAGDRKVVPIKKPILSKPLNRDYILGDVEEGKIGINTVKNEIEDIAPLFFQKQLNDVEINNIVNNLNYLDKLLNPTNILDITTKAPVKGLESLKPTSIAGGLEKAGKQLEEVGKKLEETKPEINIGDLIKDFAQGQRAMQSEQRRGLTRATARSILYDDIKSGKIKGMTLEQLGSAKDPIDDFRKIYGENALEQLDSLADDFSQMTGADEAAKFAKTRFKFEPRTGDLPETTTIEEAKKAEQEFGINKPAKVKDFKAEATKRTSIDDLIDEYNANQDRLRLSDEEGGTAISYDEFRKLQERNRQIADALENKGISSKIEEEVKPEGIVIPFRKKITEPEEFADGGIIRTKFAAGGKGKKILDIIKKANKELKGKKSMETFDLKTGEVIPTKEPIMTAESKSRKLTQDEIADYEEAIGRDSEQWMLEGTVDEAEKALKKSKAEEAYYRGQYKAGKLDPLPGEQTEDRMKFLQKKFDEVLATGDRKHITLEEAQELQNLQFSLREKAKQLEQNMIKQKYGSLIDDVLLKQILVDANPQRKAEVLATIDEALKMQQKGMSPQEIVDIIKNTTRTKQAKGGSVGMDYLMGF
jgi:hypothetical protein